MKIFVGQIYIEPGVAYPFSHHFQIWISEELTKRIRPSTKFINAYSDDYNLIFNLSAKSKILEPEIKGPTVFKDDKDVEFTIFLPYEIFELPEKDEYEQPLILLFSCIVQVLQSLGMDVSRLERDAASLIKQARSDPSMIAVRKPLS